ncbi:diphosphomevalonate decarboxylase [Liberibacter crescens]|uniref:diphosphomevalonate decarboxylase n=1 Tax=Liberibacter crescens TaxID=1273132 RepID=UPI001FCAEB89|nr:diphosphomevalonate decarboxylase [Liberibacter crescens]
MSPLEAFRLYIKNCTPVLKKEGSAFAPSNIALCKYWGKRQTTLNLPENSSLSISLGQLGSFTRIEPIKSDRDIIILNGSEILPETSFFKRTAQFCNLFRQLKEEQFLIETMNTIPTKAGLASSASGFAALTLALARLYSLPEDPSMLSRIARLGSGSACRSFYKGFCEWIRGEKDDGTDSFAVPLDCHWPNLRIGLLLIDKEKEMSSHDAMNHVRQTSPFYLKWIEETSTDFISIKQAVIDQQLTQFGEKTEHNALKMHATMISSWPPVLYWQEKTMTIIDKTWAARRDGIEVYFTIDAGPNVKLLFMQDTEQELKKIFPEIMTIDPFDGPHLLEENDR